MTKEIPASDPDLTAEQAAKVANLTDKELQEIDEALLSNTSAYFRKVARVVGTTMSELQNRVEEIPDVFYAQRIRILVKEGKLESQGELKCMRFSEVRITGELTCV